MKLKIAHRLLLLQLLPGEGDISLLRIVKELKSSLSFSEEEFKEKIIRREGDMFHWGSDKEGKSAAEVDIPVDVEIGERAFDCCQLALRQASSAGELTEEYIPLYEHFVEGKEWELASS